MHHCTTVTEPLIIAKVLIGSPNNNVVNSPCSNETPINGNNRLLFYLYIFRLRDPCIFTFSFTHAKTGCSDDNYRQIKHEEREKNHTISNFSVAPKATN